MATLKELKSIACEAIDLNQESLLKVNREIWEHPELNFQERHAHDVLTEFLETHGFEVERSYILETAYRCVYGGEAGGRNVAVLSEYDALPGIGHACGHNLIAEAGVAAAVGIKAAIDAASKKCGKVTVLGAPAEERGGGKVTLIRNGAFEGVDAAMMVHPFPGNMAHVTGLTAVSVLSIIYEGKASHAAAAPWEGLNALNAAVTCYQTISNQRQQMKPTWRVHGIIKNGGAKANVIPEKTELEYFLRTTSLGDMGMLKEKILNCVTAAASATGCKVKCQFEADSCENMLSNRSFADAFKENAMSLGVEYDMPESGAGGGSTDMGNVSHVVPSIHPFYSPGDSKAANHTRAFTKAAGSKEAHSETIKQAKAMAMTALDIFYNDDLFMKMKDEFTRNIAMGN